MLSMLSTFPLFVFRTNLTNFFMVVEGGFLSMGKPPFFFQKLRSDEVELVKSFFC
jgi:hypothetical protein